MKLLDGAELAGFIKERQAKVVRGLVQAWGVKPKLAVVVTNEDPASLKYVSLKASYADDIGVDLEVYKIKQNMVPELLDEIKKDSSIHGVILQLPLENPDETETLCALIPPEKDVDSLGPLSKYEAATPLAISWLLSGYSIDLKERNVVVLGNGKLVGKPMAELLKASGLTPVVLDENTKASVRDEAILAADVLITATGKPALVTADMLKSDAVIVDAGVASENGALVGDVADDVRQMPDISITPKTGGVGPLTIAALFENLLTAARGQKGNLPQEG